MARSRDTKAPFASSELMSARLSKNAKAATISSAAELIIRTTEAFFLKGKDRYFLVT